MNINFFKKITNILQVNKLSSHNKLNDLKNEKKLFQSIKKSNNIKNFLVYYFISNLVLLIISSIINIAFLNQLGIIVPIILAFGTSLLIETNKEIIKESLNLNNNSILNDKDIEEKNIELEIEHDCIKERHSILTSLEKDFNELTSLTEWLEDNYSLNTKNILNCSKIDYELQQKKLALFNLITSMDKSITKHSLLKESVSMPKIEKSLNLLSIALCYTTPSLITSLKSTYSALENSNLSVNRIEILLLLGLIGTSINSALIASSANQAAKMGNDIINKLILRTDITITSEEIKYKDQSIREIEHKISRLSEEIYDIEKEIILLEEKRNSLLSSDNELDIETSLAGLDIILSKKPL